MDEQSFNAIISGVQGQGGQSALVKQLRGQHDLGSLYSMSPTLSGVGQQMQKTALSTAKQAGDRRQQGLTRARQKMMDEEQQRRYAVEQGQKSDALEREARIREEDIARGDADAAEQHRRAMELQKLKELHANNRATTRASATGGIKESAKERQDRVKSRHIFEEAGRILDAWKPGSTNPWVDVPASILDDTMFESMKPVIEEKAYTPEQREQRVRGAQVEGQISKILAGLNLTGFELIERKRWSPFTPGVGTEQSKERMEILRTTFLNEVNTRRGAVGLEPLADDTSFAKLMGEASDAVSDSAAAAASDPTPVGSPIELTDGTVWQEYSDGSTQQVE